MNTLSTRASPAFRYMSALRLSSISSLAGQPGHAGTFDQKCVDDAMHDGEYLAFPVEFLTTEIPEIFNLHVQGVPQKVYILSKSSSV